MKDKENAQEVEVNMMEMKKDGFGFYCQWID
jgi:hypothetical protein